ncbi:hypothetical protein ACOSP7_003872 [Xanthoceras sorbifolium]
MRLTKPSDLLYSTWLRYPNMSLNFIGEAVRKLIREILGTGMMARVETSYLAGSGTSFPEVMVKLNYPSQQVLGVLRLHWLFDAAIVISLFWLLHATMSLNLF